MISNRKTSQKVIIFWLVLCCSLTIQVLIIFAFRQHLRYELPVYFHFNGTVIYWFYYRQPIILPGILLLVTFHIGGLLFYKYIPILLSSILLLEMYFKSLKFIGRLLFAWIESLTWVMLLYFFVHSAQVAYVMLTINTFYLSLVIFRTAYYLGKSFHENH